jgi:hypothetical protein
MSQSNLPLKIEAVAEIFQTESGAFVIRPRLGRKFALNGYAKVTPQADGSFRFDPLEAEIEMDEAASLLNVPYTTLRRIIEMDGLKAYKRSPGRWVVVLSSVIELKKSIQEDPEFWDKLKVPEPVFQNLLKL